MLSTARQLTRVSAIKQSVQVVNWVRRIVTTTTDNDGIFFISINRPERRNAVNVETGNHLYSAFLKFNESEDARVGIFHSSGGDFCAGFDLKELSTFGSRGDDEIKDLLHRRGPMV